MMNRIICLAAAITIVAASLCAQIKGEWRLYSTFGNEIVKVVDTPRHVFIQALAQPYAEGKAGFSEKTSFLFAYDKEAQEMLNLSKQNLLSSTIVDVMAYNPDKKYLLVAYADGLIDIITDRLEVKSIDALKETAIATGKHVHHINFNPKENRAYLATDFGYVEINDQKFEIADSRNYETALRSVLKMGTDIIILTDKGALRGAATAPRRRLSDYSPLELPGTASELLGYGDGKVLILTDDALWDATISEGSLSGMQKLRGGGIRYLNLTEEGVYAAGYEEASMITPHGEISFLPLPPDDRNAATASRDMRTFQIVHPLKGLSERRYDNGWTTLHEAIAPNAAAPFITQKFLLLSDGSVILAQHGVNRLFPDNTVIQNILISRYADGQWTHLSPSHTGIKRPAFRNPSQLAADPDNEAYIYAGSFYNGLARFSTNDPADIIQFGQAADPAAGEKGFHIIVPTQSWDEYCNFGAPAFDTQGNLWTIFDDLNAGESEGLWVWPAEGRRKEDVSAWIHIHTAGYEGEKSHLVLPLRHPSNQNLVVFAPGTYEGPLFVLNHHSTLSDESDDEIVAMTTLYDHDGNEVRKDFIYTFYEDPQSGNVIAGTTNGIFVFNPHDVFADPSTVRRIKIARNDGTQLADYLLDGVPVYAIADLAGKKWWATGGAGLVVTSADGMEINASLTKENSLLPADDVYAADADVKSGIIYLSTSAGMASFKPAYNPSPADTKPRLKIYPSPVKPGFYGLVTIEGLPDGTRTRIYDSGGSLVAILDPAQGGEAKWTLADMTGKRVKAGIYHAIAQADGFSAKGIITIIE